MRYHLFQKFFEKMVKIKETSFLLSKCLVSIAHHCRQMEEALIYFLRKYKPLYPIVLMTD